MNITVIGIGHVGLVTAAVLADDGHSVVGLDSDPVRVRELQSGVVPFHEPLLETLVSTQTDEEHLRFTDDPEEALDQADVAFICVGTPESPTGSANLVAVEQAAQLVAKFAPAGVVVVEKSTVPAGTSRWVEQTLRLYGRDDDSFSVVSSPEFLSEGTAVSDTLHPTRVVVGFGPGAEKARAVMREVYERHSDVYVETDVTTAELAKHACNSYLATRVSFINAMARMCESVGANVRDVETIMGLDPRIGPDYLTAGIGYGGYCLPKDVQALEMQAFGVGANSLSTLLESVHRINEEAVWAVVNIVREELWNLEGKRVAVLGVTFKPGTDDTRDSPALPLIGILDEAGADVRTWDPVSRDHDFIGWSDGLVEALKGASCAVIATAWPQIATALPMALNVMEQKIVVDAVGLTSAARLPGARYRTVGVPRGE